jgi:hypothetical protein
MTDFKGFPDRMTFTPIPNLVFSSLMPQITDIIELKVLLHIFKIIYPKKGSLRFTSYNEMLGQDGLVSDLKGQPEEALNRALAALVEKGILLSMTAELSGNPDRIYLFNNEANRLSLERVQRG